MNKSKNLFLGFLFTLLILVSITAISAASDTNTTGTQSDVQDVTTPTAEPAEKVASAQVTKTQETDDKIKTTTKENKKETTKTTAKKQNTTKTVKTTAKSLKQDDTTGTFTQLQQEINTATTSITLERDYARSGSEYRVNISSAITINGNGHTIDANKGNGVFLINSTDVVLANMTIKNNNGTSSAVEIRSTQSLTVKNVTFENNNRTITKALTANGGGAIYNNGISLTADNCTFNNNSASLGGAISINQANTTLTNVIFTNNNATYDTGGAIYCYNNNMGKPYYPLTMTNTTFRNNTATNAGGVGYIRFTDINMTNVAFINNTSLSSKKTGGAMHISTCNMTLTNGQFINNRLGLTGGLTGTQGGAMNICYGTNATITNITCKNNEAEHGVISLESNNIMSGYDYRNTKLCLYNSTIENNMAAHIIYLANSNFGTFLDIQNCSFINNKCNNTFFNESIGASNITTMYNNTFIGNNLTATMSINTTKIEADTVAKVTIKPVTDLWNTTVSGGSIKLTKEDGTELSEIPVNEEGSVEICPEPGYYNLIIDYLNSDNNFTAEPITVEVAKPKGLSKINVDILNTTATNTTIKATVKDREDNPITEGTVVITHTGSTYEIGRGNLTSDGTVTIKTNLHAGTFNINVTYLENADYDTCSYNTSVEITKMPTTLTLTPENSTYGNTSINVLFVTQDGEPVKNATLLYSTDDAGSIPHNVYTDDEGKANIHLDLAAPLSYKITVTFDSRGGNTTYNTTENSLEITVNKAKSYVEIETLNNKTTNTTIKVTVTNCTNQPITNGYLDVNGTIIPVESNGTTIIKLNITKPGELSFKVEYQGNDNYTDCKEYPTINIRQVNTKITLDPISSAKVGHELTISGKVEDEDGNLVSGFYDINFAGRTIVDGELLSDGKFNVQYTPTEAGGQNLQIDFLGDADPYSSTTSMTNKSSFFERIDVVEPTPKITIEVNEDNIKVGDSIPIKVILTNEDTEPLAYQDMTITINGAKDTVTTDANGIANTTYNATRTGALIIYATYDGNNTYDAKTVNKTVYVTNLQTNISLNNITTKINETQNITITVKDERGYNVNTGRIILKINGKTLRDSDGNIITAIVTNGTANITTTFNQRIGVYQISAVYGGSTNYEPSKNTDATLTVTPRESQISFNEEITQATIGSELSFTINITDEDKQVNTGRIIIKLNGRTVRDPNGNILSTPVTNGQADIKFKIPDTFRAKVYTLTAVYGDKEYNRAEISTQIELTNPVTTQNTMDTGIFTTTPVSTEQPTTTKQL